ncbi:protein PTST homolog 2, chloroplastic [Diospyros lotus]|uniref:protein PTST homolog 2, chloroplastic n=1 Tax=Diospyros lotus TaxID=55363 RepID=UPI00225B4123|nr:protein PTST homolog 2, chloroplastic [Diospyros lotus]
MRLPTARRNARPMVSLLVAPNHSLVPPRLAGDWNSRAVPLTLVVKVRTRACRRSVKGYSFGLRELERRHYEESWCCRSEGWESEGDSELEAEIFEFMKKSAKPKVFPSKKELADAGRMDLVEAVLKRGGWLSLGWDLDTGKEEENVREINVTAGYCDDEQVSAEKIDATDSQHRAESRQGSNSSEAGGEVTPNSSYSPSSSGRSLEMEDRDETGVEGILNRLEKERNLSFGINLGKVGYSAQEMSNYDGHEDDSSVETSKDTGDKFNHVRSVSNFDGPRSLLKPETWRTWSIHRAGLSNVEFEAAEISFDNNKMHEGKDVSRNEVLAIAKGSGEAMDKRKNMSHNEIRSRIQHLELELASALHLLRSNNEQFAPKEGKKIDDLGRLSDAWEFQENEIMNAQNRLRSIRAKLAVLEGKMTLAIIDAQKIVEEKQKLIDGARGALQLLRTTCVVWPNSASEVLLAGSFDGWTSQRKMEKSKNGIFSVCLKLYPGQYEIKFIVDGVWKTDPLRPIVHNNGFENNLLLIS